MRGTGTDDGMSIEIDITTGEAGWPVARPLLAAVWPPEVVQALP